MKTLLKAIRASTLILLMFVKLPVVNAATTPSLGAAANFGILGYSYANNSTFTSITGDLGYTVGPSIAPSVSGTTHINDATYTQAVNDQVSALTALNTQACTHPFSAGTVDLATANVGNGIGIYTPGVYCITGSMTIAGGGTITLNGAGTYIFRPTGTLTTSDHSHVSGMNGVSACDIFWTPGGSTTLGAVSTFAGTVIEPRGPVSLDINVGAHTNWGGRALDGDIMSVANVATGVDVTISILTCGTSPEPTTLHVIKTFTNTYGGTATSSDAVVYVKNSAGNVTGSPRAGEVAPGTAYTLNPDTYTVSEDAFAGYTLTFSGDCDSTGHVTLASGENKSCTLSNNQNPPPASPPGTLRVIKHVMNDNAGTATAHSFMMHVKGAGSFGVTDVTGSPTAGAEAPGTSYSLPAGTYVVSEDAFTGYTQSFSGDCDSKGNIAVTSGSDKTCTITNDDVPPPTPGIATLHVIKIVINDNGGTANASDATIHVKSGAGDVLGSPRAGMTSPGRTYTLTPDSYLISEDAFAGYTLTFSGDCDGTGHVALASGDNKTCTLSNNQNPPPSSPLAILHVIKHVVNDNTGTATASSFMVHVKSAGSFGLTDVTSSPAAGTEAPGKAYSLTAGTYMVSEETFAGYTQSFSGDCDSKGNIVLASGSDKTCVITNNDTHLPPSHSQPATLHVVKIVINDNGGKAVTSDAIIHVTNSLADVPGSPRAGASTPGTTYGLNPGTYTVSENFFSGYTVSITGACKENGMISLSPGDNKTCTVTNNDIAGVPHVTPPTVTPPTSTIKTVVLPKCDICKKLLYDLYIINPNKSERHTGTPWVRVTDRGNGIKRYSFEDATLDPHNPLYDYNDSVIDVDFRDCTNVKFMFVSSDASWKHRVRIKVSIGGIMQSDTLITNDSKAVVGTSKTVNSTTGLKKVQACSKEPALPLKIKHRNSG